MYSVNCKINMKKKVFFVKNHVPSEMLPFIVHYKHFCAVFYLAYTDPYSYNTNRQ